MSSYSLTGEENNSLGKENWIAECLSLSPERSLKLPRTTTAWDQFAVLYILSHLESRPWITDDIHRQVAQKAYVSDYQGEWEAVQEILELYPKTPEEFYNIFLKSHSPEEFFGNLVPRARRLLRLMRTKQREDPHRRVRKSQRHRGYRDKGTLRPSHRPRVDPPLPAKEKQDRRKKIGHPLLRN